MVSDNQFIDFTTSPSDLPATDADRSLKVSGKNHDSQPTAQSKATERPARRHKKTISSAPPNDRVCTVAIRLSSDEYLEIREYSDHVFRETGVIVSMATIGKEALLKHIRKVVR